MAKTSMKSIGIFTVLAGFIAAFAFVLVKKADIEREIVSAGRYDDVYGV